MRYCFWIFVCCSLRAWQIHQVPVEPVDIFYNNQRVKLQQIGQLVAEDEFLYLRTTQAPTLLVLGQSGVVMGGVGGPGKPGFEAGGPLSMAVRGVDLWTLDNPAQQVHHFLKGQHTGAFPLLAGDMPMAHMSPANGFASDGQHLIFTAPQGSGALGIVYSLEGKRLNLIGESIDLSPELVAMVPAINETLWFYHQGFFYAVHKFFPMVSVFGTDLQLKNQFQYSSDPLLPHFNAIHQFQPTRWMTIPTPLVTDAAVHQGQLYLMCSGVLHHLNLQDGRLLGLTSFTAGEGLSVAPGSQLNFSYLAFFGRFVYLAHPAMLWGHDLWRAPASQL